VPVAIVGSALLGVGEDLIGLAALFEFLFRAMIAGVAIGVELHRQLAIGRLEFLIRGGADHAEYFVIISFHRVG